jgi:hypothetical protein
MSSLIRTFDDSGRRMGWSVSAATRARRNTWRKPSTRMTICIRRSRMTASSQAVLPLRGMRLASASSAPVDPRSTGRRRCRRLLGGAALMQQRRHRHLPALADLVDAQRVGMTTSSNSTSLKPVWPVILISGPHGHALARRRSA